MAVGKVTVRIASRKRWFFWPAFWTLAALAKFRVIGEFTRAALWLAEHGIVWEIEHA